MKITFSIDNRTLAVLSVFFVALASMAFVFAQAGQQSHPWSQITCTGCISSGNIATGAVTSTAIQDGAVANADIANNAVNGAKISDGSITNADISSSAGINPSKIAAGTFSTGTYRFQGPLIMYQGFTIGDPSAGTTASIVPLSSTQFAIRYNTNTIQIMDLSNNNVYFPNGDVGIGTSTADERLDVNGRILTSEGVFYDATVDMSYVFTTIGVSGSTCSSVCLGASANARCLTAMTNNNGPIIGCSANLPGVGSICLCYILT